MIGKVLRSARYGIRNVTGAKWSSAMAQIAPLQKAALEERCILVDKDDKPIGEASKRDCHKVGQDGNILLHRAFSVFLFNGKRELLLQKRSATKVTFPDYYSNTCCSHPLAEIPGEMEERDALGVRRAAQRRLAYELGIPPVELEPSAFVYLTRIHYHAPGEGAWGEHEIDYILFLQKDVDLDPNPDEVSEVRWIPKTGLDGFIKENNASMTPWFRLLCQHKLRLWWDNLHNLKRFEDHNTIQRW